jgi:hypothetical protein
MRVTIGPDVATAAAALRRSHPHVTARQLLDLVLDQRTGAVADFGAAIAPGHPFALLVAEAFDRGMSPDEWAAWTSPGADPLLVTALLQVWHSEVLPRFAAAYGLTL